MVRLKSKMTLLSSMRTTRPPQWYQDLRSFTVLTDPVTGVYFYENSDLNAAPSLTGVIPV